MRVDIFGLQTMLKAVVAECTIAFIVPIPRVFNMLQYVHLTRTLEDYFLCFLLPASNRRSYLQELPAASEL